MIDKISLSKLLLGFPSQNHLKSNTDSNISHETISDPSTEWLYLFIFTLLKNNNILTLLKIFKHSSNLNSDKKIISSQENVRFKLNYTYFNNLSLYLYIFFYIV